MRWLFGAVLGLALLTAAKPAQSGFCLCFGGPVWTGDQPVLYSALFTGNSPFHHLFNTLVAAGAVQSSATIATNLWGQGLQPYKPYQNAGPSALYVCSATVPCTSATFLCPSFGGCAYSGSQIFFPSGAHASSDSDHHFISVDTQHALGEVDGWGGATGQCVLSGNNLNCDYGGISLFASGGLMTNGNSANHAGYAYGAIMITSQDLLQGHIDHALGIDGVCLNNPSVYPATSGLLTDQACTGAAGQATPTASYGNLVHLANSVSIPSLGVSYYCAVILTAFQRYGAYTIDTGNNGIGFRFEPAFENPLWIIDPWTSIIYPSMVAGGDATGIPQVTNNFTHHSCLDKITAGQIEVWSINSTLPPIGTP